MTVVRDIDALDEEAFVGVAREGRYEIHEDGPLGHTETCDERWKARQASA